MDPLLAMVLAAVVVGAVLLVLGLRGRRVNTHPVCRNCRFDLVGLWPGKGRCPECGRRLDAARAVRRGVRRRRPGLVVLGACILVPGLIVTGVMLAGFIAGPRLNPNKPVWLLAYEARYAADGRAGPALAELAARLDTLAIGDPQQVSGLIEPGLARQANLARAWVQEWGDFLLAADRASLLSDAQIARFYRNAINVKTRFRPRSRVGQSVPFGLEWSTLRVGSGALAVQAEVQLMVREVAGMQQGPEGAMRLSIAPGGSLATTYQLPAPARAGPAPWRAVLQTTITGMSRSRRISWEDEYSGEIAVVGPDEPLVEVIRADSIADRMKAGLRPRELQFDPSGASLTIDHARLPAPISFEIILAWDDEAGVRREAVIGSISLPAETAGSYGMGGDAELRPPAGLGEIEVILRPSAAAAERNPEIERTWLGPDLVYRVRVEGERLIGDR